MTRGFGLARRASISIEIVYLFVCFPQGINRGLLLMSYGQSFIVVYISIDMEALRAMGWVKALHLSAEGMKCRG